MEFRQCVQHCEIPLSDLGASLEELVDHWEDVKIFFKESGTTPTPRGRTPVDLGQVIVSDTCIAHFEPSACAGVMLPVEFGQAG